MPLSSNSLRLALPLLCLCALLQQSCGSASRARFASLELAKSGGAPEALAGVRSSDPLIPGIWGYSAMGVARDPAAALEFVNRGLKHQPRDAQLLLFKADLTGRTGDEPALWAVLDDALAGMPAANVEAWLRSARVRAHLATDDLDAAEEEILRLGGLSSAAPAMLASSWALLALGAESLGMRERANAAMDLSLDRGPGARNALQEGTSLRPERQAAGRSLIRRTSERHPGQTDMALAQAVELMIAERYADCEVALAALPVPVPARLASEIFAVHSRVVLLQGRTEEGLAVLRDQLRRDPTNGFAIDVLLEAWIQRSELSDQEMAGLLDRSWRALRSRGGSPRASAVFAKVEAALQEIHKRLETERKTAEDAAQKALAPETGPPGPPTTAPDAR